MKIALDFDSTLAKSMERWVDIYNHLYPQNAMSITDVTSWDFERRFGITFDKKIWIFKKVWSDWRSIQPEEPGQYYLVEKLNQLGIVDIVTTIDPAYTQFAEKWCILHGIRYNKLVHAENGHKHELQYDYFIDDNPEMVERIRTSTDKFMFLYNQNWNQHVKTGGNVKRIYTLTDVYNHIREDLRLKNIPVPIEEPDEDFIDDDEDEDWDDEDDEEFEEDEV